MKRTLVALFVGFIGWTTAQGQVAPAPLLHVRFQGPGGTHVTFFQGTPDGRRFPAPVHAGLRPGYIYRVMLSDLRDYPGLTLFPTLEVRGSLLVSPKLNPAAHPAPVVFTAQDIDRARAGALITKVIYLENPENALAAAASLDDPLEVDVPANRDALEEARRQGRPVLIVRLGEREVSREELACQSVPGTVLLPGDPALGPPAAPPCLPASSPTIRPEEECLHDGGDTKLKVSFDRFGRLQGLDPTDTVAEYADSRGRKDIAVSNRLCLCVPRFAILRKELPLGQYDTVVAVERTRLALEAGQAKLKVPSLEALQNDRLKGYIGPQRLSGVIAAQGPSRLIALKVLNADVIPIGLVALIGTVQAETLTEVQRTRLLRQMEFARVLSQPLAPAGVDQRYATTVVGRVKGLDLVTAVWETRDLTVCCNEVPRPPDRPLVLYKCADRTEAQVGDVVTFYLRYSNHGGQPISDIAVSDSLTARLEYVEGSAQSDRAAVFTTQTNEAGSLILRWEIGGNLLPGEGGVVKFQVRIR